jgi:hypothetical protein
MNAYRPESANHRPLFALAAIALTALTIGAAVVAPAKLDGLDFDGRTLPAAKDAAPTAVVISPARIDIVAVREQKAAVVDSGRVVRPKA